MLHNKKLLKQKHEFCKAFKIWIFIFIFFALIPWGSLVLQLTFLSFLNTEESGFGTLMIENIHVAIFEI